MSKKSKTKAAEDRKKKKKAMKTAQQARYESYKLAGTNHKSKRFQRNSKIRKIVGGKDQSHGLCGNVGCKKCTPLTFERFLNNNGQPQGMPQWLWLKYKAAG